MAKLSQRLYLNKIFKFEYAITYTPNTTDSKKFTKQDIKNKVEQTLLRTLKTHDKNAKIIIIKVINNNAKDRKDKAHTGIVHYHIVILTNKRIDKNSKFNWKYFTFHIQEMYYAKGWIENYIHYKHHILQITHNFERIQHIKITSKSLKSIIEMELIIYLMCLSLNNNQYIDKKVPISLFKKLRVQKYAVF